MRSVIMMGCLWMLSLTTLAQSNGRVRSGTPLRWSMNGSIEVMDGDLARYYGSTNKNTIATNRLNRNASVTAYEGNPNATRFSMVQAQCDQNSILLNWAAIQQPGADRYEIEQSEDGYNWTVVGTVPANRTELGEASYNFKYNKNVSNAQFRIMATNIAGERISSSILESPCSNDAYLNISPNPVYSTTTLRIGSPTASRVNMLLLDARGIVMLSRDAGLMQGINNVPLDLSSLPRGSYTIVIRWFNGKQETLKVSKQ
jgi:hypothetical protein